MTYNITAIYFILHAEFGLLVELFSTGKVIIRHLGWLSHWTMGWACHLDGWGDWGMLRRAAVSWRAGGPPADCWHTGCKASSYRLQPHYPTSPSKVSWRLNDTWRVNLQITKDALDYRGRPIDHVAGPNNNAPFHFLCLVTGSSSAGHCYSMNVT